MKLVKLARRHRVTLDVFCAEKMMKEGCLLVDIADVNGVNPMVPAIAFIFIMRWKNVDEKSICLRLIVKALLERFPHAFEFEFKSSNGFTYGISREDLQSLASGELTGVTIKKSA